MTPKHGPRTRRLLKLCLIGLLCGLGTLLLPATALNAQEPGDDSISGQVYNGTSDAPLPQDHPVMVLFLVEDDEWGATYTTTLASDGSYRFDDLEKERGAKFLVYLDYQNVIYYADLTTLQGKTRAPDITIYESTTDATLLHIEDAQIFIVPQGDTLHISEIYKISNLGEHTYIGSAPPGEIRTTLSFTLPTGSDNLNLTNAQLGSRYVGSTTHFGDTYPVSPGTNATEISFSYTRPYRDAMTFAHTFDIALHAANVVINAPEISLLGENFVRQDDQNTQMGPANTYKITDLAASTPLIFRISKQTPQLAAGTLSLAEIGVGLIAIASAGLLCTRLWQPPALPPMPEAARPLLLALIDLNAAFDADEIPTPAYRQQRDILLAQVRATIAPEG